MKATIIKNHLSPGYLVVLAVIGITQFTGCASVPKVAVRPNEHMEIGWTPRTVFQSPAYAWFDSGYTAYQPQKDVVERLRHMKDSVTIVIIYGTWCSDSRRELPRFFKVMDLAEFSPERIQLIATDRAKQLPAGIAKEFAIILVPTFIVRFRGFEIGRIIESPKKSMEQDLVEILLPLFQ